MRASGFMSAQLAMPCSSPCRVIAACTVLMAPSSVRPSSRGVPVASAAPNIAFKPKLHRYASHMAEKACHVPGYALQFGLT
jgi:hypothetical protein